MAPSFVDNNTAAKGMKDQIRAQQAKNSTTKPEWAKAFKNEKSLLTKGPRPLHLVDKHSKGKSGPPSNSKPPRPKDTTAQKPKTSAENPYCSGAIQEDLPIQMIDAENGQRLPDSFHRHTPSHLHVHEGAGDDQVKGKDGERVQNGELPPIKTIGKLVESAFYLYQMRTYGDNEKHSVQRARAKRAVMSQAFYILLVMTISLGLSIGVFVVRRGEPPADLVWIFVWMGLSGAVVLWAIVALILIQWSKKGLKNDLEVARMGDAFNATTAGVDNAEGCFVNGVRYKSDQPPKPDSTSDEAGQPASGQKTTEAPGSGKQPGLDIIRESKGSWAHHTRKELSKLSTMQE
ncbi:hypothetical protein CORC01_12586 [Colletotrichum orchidophilum]|uniref:Uncharacterized protein n=1 Tax=Colletotrichum orchidophilum TaxID=1209926 RepID=A0A1G4ASQ3_9PEZI|nr:uncharacterized protein CORC01_12586 [Colletotrichum orchidophilum]OHE92131.1 hypothetical protein CORC01_12586 [Colletotrichum orchidophilum]